MHTKSKVQQADADFLSQPYDNNAKFTQFPIPLPIVTKM